MRVHIPYSGPVVEKELFRNRDTVTLDLLGADKQQYRTAVTDIYLS